MTKKKTPKSGSPAVFWVLFGAPFGALEPNTSTFADEDDYDQIADEEESIVGVLAAPEQTEVKMTKKIIPPKSGSPAL